jgi:hypothetical protein
MSKLLYPPSVNAVSKQLNANYTAADAVITLTNTTSIQNLPGACLINRIDSAGTLQPTANWTYIEYEGTSGATLTGCTAISGDQDQALGKVVEFISDVTAQQRILDALANLVAVNTGALDTTKVVTPAGTQTLENKTLTSPTINTPTITTPTINNPTTKSTTQVVVATNATVGGTTTLDLATGGIQNITMGAGNTTIALSNATTNQPFIISITQPNPGSRTVTWFSTIKWAGGSAPTLTTTANKRDTFGFICTGTNTYDGYVVGQNI